MTETSARYTLKMLPVIAFPEARLCVKAEDGGDVAEVLRPPRELVELKIPAQQITK